MFPSRVLHGGGRHFLAPKSVWSTAGGWWGSSSAHADEKRATLIGYSIIAVAVAVISNVSISSMVRFSVVDCIKKKGRRQECCMRALHAWFQPRLLEGLPNTPLEGRKFALPTLRSALHFQSPTSLPLRWGKVGPSLSIFQSCVSITISLECYPPTLPWPRPCTQFLCASLHSLPSQTYPHTLFSADETACRKVPYYGGPSQQPLIYLA